MPLTPASGPSGAAASTASPDAQRKIAARPKQAYLQLRPSTRQTVVKTITTTTIHYAPIPIDRPPSPELGSSHELDRARYPLELSRKGRVAGLHYGENGERWNGELHLSLEDAPGGRARPAVYHSNAPGTGGTGDGEQYHTSSQLGDRKGKRRAREEEDEETPGNGDERAVCRPSQSREAGEPAAMQPGPSKRRRLSATLDLTIPSPSTEPSKSQELQKRYDPDADGDTSASQGDETKGTLHAPRGIHDHSETSRDRLSVTSQAGLPSPAISLKLAGTGRPGGLETLPRSGSRRAVTVSEEEVVEETEDAGFLAEHTGNGEQQLSLGGVDATLPTLLSLNSLVSTFATLQPDLQMHVLYNLMRHVPVPVIQSINHLIQPALKRDFISDLPTELATQVLHHLDLSDIMLCLSVSKNWKRFIDAQGELWSRLIKEDDLWVGDPKDTEGRECQTLLRAGTRNKRTGVELGMHELLNLQDSDAALFCQRWKYGMWNHHCDAANAARPTAWKIEQAQQVVAAREKQEKVGSSTEPGQTVMGSDQANRLRKTITLPHIRNQYKIDQSKTGQTPAAPGDKLDGYVHPLKLIYKRRLTVRKHWYRQRPPNRITVTAQHSSIVTAVQFDNDKLITASDDHAIDVYDTRSGRLRMRLRGHDGGIWALQYVGNILVSGSTDRSTRVWDLDTGLCTHVFHGHTSTVRCLKIVQPVNVNPDPNGPPVWEPPYPLIVTGARDNTVRIWKLPQHNSARSSHQSYAPPSPSDEAIDPNANPHHIACLRGHTAAIRALAAEGRVIVSGSYDCNLRVWDTLTGKCQYLLEGHKSKVYSVVLDVERKRCASGSMDGSVRLWCLETGAGLYRLDGHSSLVGLLQLSYHFLVSAGADSTLKLWDPATGTCINTLAAHAGAITCFEHDDFRVVSGTEGQIRLWDIRKGVPIRDLVTDMAGVWQVAYSDRYTVAAVQRDGTTEYEILDFFPELRDEKQDAPLSPTLTPDVEIGHPGLAEHGSPPGHGYPYGEMSFETPVQTSKLPAMHHHGHHLNRPPGRSSTEAPSTPIGAGNASSAQAALPWHLLEQTAARDE